MADPLEVLDNAAARACGLPPDRGLVDAGLVTALERFEGLLDGELPPLFFRSFPALLDALESVFGADEAMKGGRGGPRDWKVSRTALISRGIGTLCTTLTARQSAAGIERYSEGKGARQQPGHPGLL